MEKRTYYKSFIDLSKGAKTFCNYDERIVEVFESDLFKTCRVKVFSDDAFGKYGRRQRAAKESMKDRNGEDPIAIFVECTGGVGNMFCNQCASTNAEYKGSKKYCAQSWLKMVLMHCDGGGGGSGSGGGCGSGGGGGCGGGSGSGGSGSAGGDAANASANATANASEDAEIIADAPEGIEGIEGNASVIKKSKKPQQQSPQPQQQQVFTSIQKEPLKHVQLKKLITSIVIPLLKPLINRIDNLERHVTPNRAMVQRPYAKTAKGMCKGCGEKTKIKKNGSTEHVPLRPHYIPFDIMGSLDEKGKDPRMRDSESFDKLIQFNKYCATCAAKTTEFNYLMFSLTHRFAKCMLCRSQNAIHASMFCADCNCTELRNDHANYKKPLHNAFIFLAKTVNKIESVKTSVSLDTDNIHKGEYPVDHYGKIDFMVLIRMNGAGGGTSKKSRGPLLMFAIEVLATKIEELPKHAHKFARAREKTGADKTFVIAFDIKETGHELYKLEQKIDILRRWIIFAVQYAEYLPNMNNWWFFSKRNAYAMRGYEDRMADFYKYPVKIDGPPKAKCLGSCGSDWEFASDSLAVPTPSPANAFNYLADESRLIDPNELMFKGGFPNYALYNVDKEVDVARALRCTTEGCEMCKAFYT